jgi:hypothetical protein
MKYWFGIGLGYFGGHWAILLQKVWSTWDRYYGFKIFSPKKMQKISAFDSKTKLNHANFFIIALVFEKNTIFSKIGKNRRKL